MASTTVQQPSTGKRVLKFIKKHISISAFIVIFLFFTIYCFAAGRASFIAIDNLKTILEQSIVTMIVAFGVFFAILQGGIDLSVGSVLGLSGVISASVFVSCLGTGMPDFLCTILAILTGVAVGFACGAINGLTHSYMKIPSFIATLGMLSIARALCTIYTGGSIISIPFESSFKKLGMFPWIIIIGAIFFVLTLFLHKRTVFGRYVRMIGGDENVARLCGIKVARYKFYVMTLCGILAGCGGIVMAARMGSGSPTTGDKFEMDAISSVVLGGTPLSGGFGSITGTLIGALILAMINNGLVLIGISSEWQMLVKGLILILAVFMSLERDKIGVIK